MKKHGLIIAATFVSAMAVLLSSCGEGAQPQLTGASSFDVAGYRGATLATDGEIITAQRQGEGAQGVTLRRSAVLVHFTVEGEGARIRISRGDQSVVSRARADNAVMIGGNGASSVVVFSHTAPEVAVTITSVVDCDAPRAGCRPPVFPDDQPAAAAGAPEAPAPAAAP